MVTPRRTRGPEFPDRLNGKTLRRLPAEVTLPHPIVRRLEATPTRIGVEHRCAAAAFTQTPPQVPQHLRLKREFQRLRLIVSHTLRNELGQSHGPQDAARHARREG